jgi:hypothetical protein
MVSKIIECLIGNSPTSATDTDSRDRAASKTSLTGNTREQSTEPEEAKSGNGLLYDVRLSVLNRVATLYRTGAASAAAVVAVIGVGRVFLVGGWRLGSGLGRVGRGVLVGFWRLIGSRRLRSGLRRVRNGSWRVGQGILVGFWQLIGSRRLQSGLRGVRNGSRRLWCRLQRRVVLVGGRWLGRVLGRAGSQSGRLRSRSRSRRAGGRNPWGGIGREVSCRGLATGLVIGFVPASGDKSEESEKSDKLARIL